MQVWSMILGVIDPGSGVQGCRVSGAEPALSFVQMLARVYYSIFVITLDSHAYQTPRIFTNS